MWMKTLRGWDTYSVSESESFRSDHCPVLWAIQRKAFFHFTSCNFILISKALASCNPQVGAASVSTDLLRKKFWKFYLYFLHHTVMRPHALFLEGGLLHRWEKKGLKFYPVKHSVRIYIVSLVTWCFGNTRHWRTSKTMKTHGSYK